MLEELLPKPQTDLPLLEKELESGEKNLNQTVKNEKLESKPPILKFVLFGFVLVIIIAGLSGAYILGSNQANKQATQIPAVTQAPSPSPEADPTANWKTYKNIQEGWQIKYPSDKVSYKNGRFYLIGQDNIMTADGYGPELFITRADKSTLESRRNSGQEAEINDLPVLKISSSNPNSPEDYNLFVSNKDQTKVVYATFLTKKDQDKTQNGNHTQTIVDQESIYLMKKIASQILSTFKFTDSTPQSSTDTSDWKTYTSKCNLSVKYPPTWTAEKYFIVDSDDSCTYIRSDKYKSGLDTRDGFYIEIKRKNMSQDEYFKEVENSTGSHIPAANKKNRTLGGHQGTSFEPARYDGGTEFIFKRNNSLYVVNWPTKIEADNLTYIENILSSIKFN